MKTNRWRESAYVQGEHAHAHGYHFLPTRTNRDNLKNLQRIRTKPTLWWWFIDLTAEIMIAFLIPGQLSTQQTPWFGESAHPCSGTYACMLHSTFPEHDSNPSVDLYSLALAQVARTM